VYRSDCCTGKTVRQATLVRRARGETLALVLLAVAASRGDLELDGLGRRYNAFSCRPNCGLNSV